jgi:uncharacterized protein YndB with AHSA1/START domain
MQIDFNAHLNAVTHSVTLAERDGRPARSVTLERTYDTTVEDLWDAVTNPTRLSRWFLNISGDLRLGGRYQFEGNAGGTITDCEPPRFVAGTWEFGGGVSWVEVRLTPDGDTRSRLTLSHICPVDPFWEQFGPGAVGVGWDLGLVGLSYHLIDKNAERPSFDEEAFAASDDGRAIITRASEGWGRAAIAGGEDPAQALAAVKRTTAFYTGQEPEAE